jgi:hypothetical protein
MHKVSGGCYCGNIGFEMGLTQAPDAYNPRACDCDFCRKHGAAYVSDARGSLLIRIKDEGASGKYRQGSGQAEFLLCRNCGVLVSVLFRNEGRLYGTVNAQAVDALTSFGTQKPVSPKMLSGDEKAVRWQDVWFSDVGVVSAGV